MRWVWRYIALSEAFIRWLSRRSGLYRIDVALALREARQLDELAVSCERQGLAESAAKLRDAAALNRVRAAQYGQR